VRVVKDTLPKAFLFENVQGITQRRHEQVITYMVDQFRNLGFGISWALLNAADYGVPQKRFRFFLLGIRGSEKPAFPLPTHFENDQTRERFISAVVRRIPVRLKEAAT